MTERYLHVDGQFMAVRRHHRRATRRHLAVRRLAPVIESYLGALSIEERCGAFPARPPYANRVLVGGSENRPDARNSCGSVSPIGETGRAATWGHLDAVGAVEAP
jgi:hypothetical protein